MKIITKTAAQALVEEAEKISNHHYAENVCPECGNVCYFGVEEVEFKGFLLLRMYKRTSYDCSECGCEWNTGWERPL